MDPSGSGSSSLSNIKNSNCYGNQFRLAGTEVGYTDKSIHTGINIRTPTPGREKILPMSFLVKYEKEENVEEKQGQRNVKRNKGNRKGRKYVITGKIKTKRFM